MIADDIKDTLKELSNEDLMAIIGYCEGMIDCRGDQKSFIGKKEK